MTYTSLMGKEVGIFVITLTTVGFVGMFFFPSFELLLGVSIALALLNTVSRVLAGPIRRIIHATFQSQS
ncbi:MAG: hypothetical protein O6846_01320 [Thaumarchaeota archaeon]|nr:hypothetical protein [Nitrososphaerota archaeon]